MKRIKRTSRTYRMVDSLFTFPSDSVCLFFWQAVWAWFLVGVAVVACIGAIALPFVVYAGGVATLNPIILFALALGSFLWAMIGAGALVACLMAITEMTDKLKSKSKKRQPSLLAEFIEAKKEKFCPRIEFVGDYRITIYFEEDEKPTVLDFYDLEDEDDAMQLAKESIDPDHHKNIKHIEWAVLS